jgi:hypothetical protein
LPSVMRYGLTKSLMFLLGMAYPLGRVFDEVRAG